MKAALADSVVVLFSQHLSINLHVYKGKGLLCTSVDIHVW